MGVGHIVMIAGLVLLITSACTPARTVPPSAVPDRITLPTPQVKGKLSLEEALAGRRSIREYGPRTLTHAEIGQLLWAAQGITSPAGFRTAPSAGALYPLEVFVLLPEGVFHYRPTGHYLQRWLPEDRRAQVGDAALRQSAIYNAPAVFVIAAVFERTAQKYGQRAERYVWIEVGHSAQNLLLQAVALNLGAVPIGAFYDERVQSALSLPKDMKPLYIIPVGTLKE